MMWKCSMWKMDWCGKFHGSNHVFYLCFQHCYQIIHGIFPHVSYQTLPKKRIKGGLENPPCWDDRPVMMTFPTWWESHNPCHNPFPATNQNGTYTIQPIQMFHIFSIILHLFSTSFPMFAPPGRTISRFPRASNNRPKLRLRLRSRTSSQQRRRSCARSWRKRLSSGKRSWVFLSSGVPGWCKPSWLTWKNDGNHHVSWENHNFSRENHHFSWEVITIFYGKYGLMEITGYLWKLSSFLMIFNGKSLVNYGRNHHFLAG